MAFGGAGPLHAARLAKELDMSRIIVPLTPGTLCALGLLLTDLRSDFAISRLMKVDQDAVEPIISGFETLEGQAESWFAQEANRSRSSRRQPHCGHAVRRSEL